MRGRPGLFALVALLAVLSAAPAHARDASVIESRRAKADFALTADPAAAPWKGVPGVIEVPTDRSSRRKE